MAGVVTSSSHCARSVESGGVFFRIGPASRTMVLTGLGVEAPFVVSAIFAVYTDRRACQKRKDNEDSGMELGTSEAVNFRGLTIGIFSWSVRLLSYR